MGHPRRFLLVNDLCTYSTNAKTITDDTCIEYLHCVLTIMPETASNTIMV